MYQMNESNSGGVGAKKGFYFQDYIATLLSSEMLLDNRIKGIGSEVADDIEVFYLDDSVTHVQVKSGTVDKSWNLKELKIPRNYSKDKKPIKESSILHKSLVLDRDPNVVSKFMVVTDMPVARTLDYLQIPIDKRVDKSGRDKLIKSIDLALGKTFNSGNGNKGEYWVDNTLWRIFSSTELLVLKVEQNLRYACEELLNCTLSNESIRQLGEILCNRIYYKSQLSKKLNTSEDKTLYRNEVIELLRNFTLNNAKQTKAYPSKKLPKIVTTLFDEYINKHKHKGFKQDFNFNIYRYDHIVNMLVDWVDEVFLKPSEIINGLQTFNKLSDIRKRISELDLKDVTSRTILHSILRSQNQSQPIPMIMFAANNSKCLKFDSVHIVRGSLDINELWIGVTEFVENSDDIINVMESICDKIEQLVFIDMDKDRKIILESKDDKYLFKHDIDSILDTSDSFSSHLDRFKFIIFISYQYSEYDYMTSESSLVIEIKSKIKYMNDFLIKRNIFFTNVRLGYYIFPTPCNDTILNKFKSKIFL